jgi:uncharacterized protein YggU (UPF0235/DUF167 family)
VTTIRVHVIPNAKIDTVVGEYGDAIKIKLRAPAVEGKTNTALRRVFGGKIKYSSARNRSAARREIT